MIFFSQKKNEILQKKKKKIYLNSKITLPLQNTHQQWLKALPWKKVKFRKTMESSPVELR